MLEINNLSTIISDTKIVDDISLRIEEGEILALIGESGSGKSMTALSIIRLLPNTAAYSMQSQILLHDSDLLGISEAQMRKVRGRDICMIFQDPMTCLNPVLTVGQQINEVLNLHTHFRGREAYIETLRLLDAVRIPLVEQRYNCYPHELSGGMKQRVMIAMALAGKPSLLIADEPTTALDVTTQAQILSLMLELQKETKMSILLITHDLAVAAQVAGRIAVMQAGKIVEQNSSVEFFAGPKHPYAQKLLQSSPATFAYKPAAMQAKSEIILSVKNLQVHFPIRKAVIKAVDGVDFDLYAGETLALVGESGSGKTTVGKAVLSLIDNIQGQVLFDGEDLLSLNQQQWRAKRADLQIIFQDPYSALNSKLMLVDSLEEGLLIQNKYSSREERLARIDELLIQVDLRPEYKWRYPHEFSGGERQRLCIARALAVEPKIIICDEPTSSLDVSIQAQVLKLLKDLQVTRNLSYLFISHDIAVVSMLAQRIAVMYQGRIVEHGLTQDVLGNPQHEYTRKLLAAVPRINITT